MPLISLREIENDCLLGSWHITESLDNPDFVFLGRDKYLKSINTASRKMASIAARMLIKQMLSHWKTPYRGLNKNENGGPELENSNFKVSLSHSGEYAVAILHTHKKIGIDIELVREKILKISHRVFSGGELEAAGKDVEKLTVLWCAKEAIYKMYADKKLSFRENIFIGPFEMESKGKISGEIRINNSKTEYKTYYEKFGDYLMAYTSDK